jgi:hypothetical protein
MPHLRCRPVFPTSYFLFKYEKWLYIEIVKFHLVVSQRKCLRIHALLQSQHNAQNVVFFHMQLSPAVAGQVPLQIADNVTLRLLLIECSSYH